MAPTASSSAQISLCAAYGNRLAQTQYRAKCDCSLRKLYWKKDHLPSRTENNDQGITYNKLERNVSSGITLIAVLVEVFLQER